jgi:hypothetical protein
MKFIHPVAVQDIKHLFSVKNNLSIHLYFNDKHFLVTGVGDPHVDTIDGGRYTCHIQGLYVFTQTNTQASTIAQYNLNNANTYDSSLIYPDDLFYIYVRSASLAPALPFVARIQGSASVYTGYTIGAGSYVFVITGSLGRFGKIIN